jgi:hypothetical protein
MSTRTASSLLPSAEWTLMRPHWHAYAQSPKLGNAPQATQHYPPTVGTRYADRSVTQLCCAHFLIASRGNSIRLNHLVTKTVVKETCSHGCVAEYCTVGRRP